MVDAYHPQKIIINNIGISMVETEEYIALGTLITVIASALALIIKQIESSKCTHIKCCGMDCDRNVPPAKEEEDVDAERPRLATPNPSP